MHYAYTSICPSSETSVPVAALLQRTLLKYLYLIGVVIASVVQWSEFLAGEPDPGFDSRRFQIFGEAVGLERGPLSLVRTTEELLGRNSSGSGQENRD
jgi:hypothetical protein